MVSPFPIVPGEEPVKVHFFKYEAVGRKLEVGAENWKRTPIPATLASMSATGASAWL